MAVTAPDHASLSHPKHRIKSQGRRIKDAADATVAKQIGRRIYLRRSQLGMSLKEFAGKLGVTYQQIYKYEHGLNRISASRLLEISEILEVSIGFFFTGLHREPITESVLLTLPLPSIPMGPNPEKVSSIHRELFRLIRAFRRIPEKAARERVIALARSFATQGAQHDL